MNEFEIGDVVTLIPIGKMTPKQLRWVHESLSLYTGIDTKFRVVSNLMVGHTTVQQMDTQTIVSMPNDMLQYADQWKIGTHYALSHDLLPEERGTIPSWLLDIPHGSIVKLINRTGNGNIGHFTEERFNNIEYWCDIRRLQPIPLPKLRNKFGDVMIADPNPWTGALPRELPDNKFYTVNRLSYEPHTKRGICPAIKFGDIVKIEPHREIKYGIGDLVYIRHLNTGVRVFCKRDRLKPLTHPIITCMQQTSTDQITTTKTAVRQVAEQQPHLEYALKMLFPQAFESTFEKVQPFPGIRKGSELLISRSDKDNYDLYLDSQYRLSGTMGYIRIEKK